jgi:hypothetical protein
MMRGAGRGPSTFGPGTSTSSAGEGASQSVYLLLYCSCAHCAKPNVANQWTCWLTEWCSLAVSVSNFTCMLEFVVHTCTLCSTVDTAAGMGSCNLCRLRWPLLLQRDTALQMCPCRYRPLPAAVYAEQSREHPLIATRPEAVADPRVRVDTCMWICWQLRL